MADVDVTRSNTLLAKKPSGATSATPSPLPSISGASAETWKLAWGQSRDSAWSWRF